ncbi:MAG TPA: ion channel [Terriglobales bacterium]|jgi:hypothetical protein
MAAIITSIFGVAIIALILLDAFETVVLPRRVTRHFRLTSWFYRNTWRPWARLGNRIKTVGRREAVLGYFGPLSLIFLLGLWAIGLIFGFTLLQYGTGQHLQFEGQVTSFRLLFYHSGETFFTLGYGDIVPTTTTARFLAVLEAGMGFAFLGVVIGYLPTIYSAFSRREIEISLLDARAGSPPTVAELLARFGDCSRRRVLDDIFRDWERWAAEVLESHLSYPVLSFFRSQHNNQSWVAALTTILDASAIVMSGGDRMQEEQARLTFAMARHAVVDLAQVVDAKYDPSAEDRLPEEDLSRLRQYLREQGVNLRDDQEATDKLRKYRSMYEPYALAIGRKLFLAVPPWIPAEKKRDNWQAGPWDVAVQARSLAGIGTHRASPARAEDHF